VSSSDLRLPSVAAGNSHTLLNEGLSDDPLPLNLHSGNKAKVQTEPPCGTFSLSCSRATFHHRPPMPDNTVTYW
jgi:hypothetical protein